ncbi:TPA: hypothetical protein ACGD7M_005075, partial [Serratia marcescens]
FRSNGKKSNRGFERGFIVFVWRVINRQGRISSSIGGDGNKLFSPFKDNLLPARHNCASVN